MSDFQQQQQQQSINAINDQSSSSAEIQVRFITRLDKYAVPSIPLFIPATSSTQQLSTILKSLLTSAEHFTDKDLANIHFDFLFDGEIIRLPLSQQLNERNIPLERLIELEYIERFRPPEPEDSYLHDDWVSACEGYGDILLVGCYDNTVHLWNTEGEHLSTLPGHNGPVRCVRWISSDENNQHCFLSSSHDEAIIRWLYNQNTNTVEELKTYKGHNGSVETISVDPTKTKFVSGSWDKTIKLWGIESGSSSPDKSENLNDKSLDARITINAHTENVSCVKWLNTNEIVSGSWDHSIKLWNMDTLKEAQTFKSTKAVIHCDYSQLNHLIVAGFCDRFIRLYDPRVSEGFVVRSTFTSHTQWVPSLSWSKTNEYVFVSGSYDSFVKLWDIRCSKAPLYDLQGHDNRVLCVDWTIPSLIISGGADNSLKLFTFNNSTQTKTRYISD